MTEGDDLYIPDGFTESIFVGDPDAFYESHAALQAECDYDMWGDPEEDELAPSVDNPNYNGLDSPF